MDPANLATVTDLIGPARVDVAGPELPGRALLLRVMFGWDDEAVTALFRLGSRVELVGSDAIRARLLRMARIALEHHGPGTERRDAEPEASPAAAAPIAAVAAGHG